MTFVMKQKKPLNPLQLLHLLHLWAYTLATKLVLFFDDLVKNKGLKVSVFSYVLFF